MKLSEIYSVLNNRISNEPDDEEIVFLYKAKKLIRIILKFYNIERIQISNYNSIYLTTDKEIELTNEESYYCDNQMVIRISTHKAKYYKKNIKKDIILKTELKDSAKALTLTKSINHEK